MPPGKGQEKLHSILPWGTPRKQNDCIFFWGTPIKICTAFSPGGHPNKISSHSSPAVNRGTPSQQQQQAGGEHLWDQPLTLSGQGVLVDRPRRDDPPHIPTSEGKGRSPPGSASRRDEHHRDQLLASRPSEYDGDHPRREICRHTPRPKRRGTISSGFCRHTPSRLKREASNLAVALNPSPEPGRSDHLRDQPRTPRPSGHDGDHPPKRGSAAMPQGQGGER